MIRPREIMKVYAEFQCNKINEWIGLGEQICHPNVLLWHED